MANGWNKLGEALAGIHPARREEIRQKTLQGLARTDSSLAQARMDLEKAKHFSQDSLGGYFLDIDSEDPEAVARAKAGIALSGINYNTLEGGAAKLQEQRFRQAARDAAVEGDPGRANNEVWGVAPGPIEIPKVSGGMLLSNRLIPGGGDVSVTPIGQSMIDRNAAQGQAAMVRANRPAASGGGRAGAPKLSAVDSARMKAELRIIDAQIDPVLNDISTYAGATAGPGARKLADAEARLAELQRQQQAIFDKYEGGSAGAPPPRVSELFGIPIPAGMTRDQFADSIAFNQSLRAEGQPDMTRDEMAQFLSTGEFKRAAPAATAPAPAGGGINPRLFDQFQQSLTGGTPAPDPRGGVARPTSKAERDRLPPGTRYIAPDGSERIKR